MTTIAISIVHFEAAKNRPVYLPHKENYIDLPALIRMLHEHKFSVRWPASWPRLDRQWPRTWAPIDFSREHKVEQLTVRPVNRPELSRDDEAGVWTKEHHLRTASWRISRPTWKATKRCS